MKLTEEADEVAQAVIGVMGRYDRRVQVCGTHVGQSFPIRPMLAVAPWTVRVISASPALRIAPAVAGAIGRVQVDPASVVPVGAHHRPIVGDGAFRVTCTHQAHGVGAGMGRREGKRVTCAVSPRADDRRNAKRTECSIKNHGDLDGTGKRILIGQYEALRCWRRCLMRLAR